MSCGFNEPFLRGRSSVGEIDAHALRKETGKVGRAKHLRGRGFDGGGMMEAMEISGNLCVILLLSCTYFAAKSVPVAARQACICDEARP